MLATRMYQEVVMVLAVLKANPLGITAGGISSSLTGTVDEKTVKEILQIAMKQGLVRVNKEIGGFTYYVLTK